MSNKIYFFVNRKLNFSDASPDGQRGSEDVSIGSGISGIPGSPALSSCSEGEPPHSPIESYISPSSRNRSPILSSSLPPHTATTQNDVDSLRLLLQEVYFVLHLFWYIQDFDLFTNIAFNIVLKSLYLLHLSVDHHFEFVCDDSCLFIRIFWNCFFNLEVL